MGCYCLAKDENLIKSFKMYYNNFQILCVLLDLHTVSAIMLTTNQLFYCLKIKLNEKGDRFKI